MTWRLCLAVWLGATALIPAASADERSAAPVAAPAKSSSVAGATPGSVGEAMYAYLSRDGAALKAPLFAEESQNLPVAQVDGEPITLEELNAAIAGAHGARGGEMHAGHKDFTPILGRLIDARLLAREAREMGIDELPEFKEGMDAFKQSAGRQLLQADALKGVAADPKEVDRIYRDAVREWTVRSILVAKEPDAKRFQADVKGGKAFEVLAKQLVAEKKAKGSEEPQVLSRTKALPEVVAALEKLKQGAVSAPVKVKDGFAVVKLEGFVYPADPKARAEAEKTSRALREKAALQKYYAGVVKRYAKTDQTLLKSLDFEAKKPGFEALRKDPRVIARIDGAKPITVSELTEALAQGFYHGVESKIKEKRLNREKAEVFDGILSARVVPLEVKRLGIEGTPEFKRRVAGYEKSLLFSKFVEKAILPELKVDEAAARKYYAEHKKEFTYPTFYKVESVAFTSLKGAEDAVKQLRGGTDFKWLNANADGQVRAADRKLGIEGTLAATSLPKELAALLAGSRKDDYRLYADDAAKQYHAIHVIDVIGATEQPFDEAKAGIGQRLVQDGLTQAIRTWSDKLRKARQVNVFLVRIGS